MLTIIGLGVVVAGGFSTAAALGKFHLQTVKRVGPVEVKVEMSEEKPFHVKLSR